MTEIAALFIAGLGLFFHGLGGLKNSVQGMASRRVRVLLARWSRNPVLAGLWGFAFGALTQSVTAVAFILASLVEGGMITVSRALPVVACANLGTALLVLVASIDINLAVLYALGVASIALAFGFGGGRMRPVLSSLFFCALLFFGLRAMKDAFAPLPSFEWFGDFARLIQGSTLAAFLAGAVLRLFIQSSPAIAVIAIALSHGGLLSDPQVMAMMFGTGMGVAGAVALLSSNLKGLPRQIAIYQGLLSGFASLVLGSCFALEQIAGWPLIRHFLEGLPGTEKLHLAYAFVAMQLVAVFTALATARIAASFLARISPPTAEQDLARTEYLSEQALTDPESALLLVEKEQERLLARIPLMIDTVRPETAGSVLVGADALRRASLSVAEDTRAYLRSIADSPLDRGTSEKLLLMERRHSLLLSLSETAEDFAKADRQLGELPEMKAHADSLAEGFHALATMLLDEMGNGGESMRGMLLSITSDRSDAMESFRQKTLAAAVRLSHEQKAHVLYTTSLYERAVWLLRQWTLTLPKRREAQG
ncbi:MAG: Na/Pi symporter [Opitutaceae bacterium]|jgi:phosphate:Na+ symporter